MLFSILIANFNNGQYIAEAIESIIRQTYTDWEIIIVDDCSTDNSIEKINSYLKQNKNIKLFQNTINQGCGYTKNQCIEFASGDICGFLDPDDTLEKNALSIMVAQHNVNTQCSVIYSTLYYCDNKLNIKHKAEWPKQIPLNSTNLHSNLITQFATFKRSFYFRTAGIDIVLKSSVDKDLYYKLEETGSTLFIDLPLYFYRENSLGISQFNNLISAQNNHLKVIKQARERRKVNKNIKNLSLFEFNALKSKYYLNRADYLIQKKENIYSILHYLFVSFLLNPLKDNKKRLINILKLLKLKR